MPKITDEQIQEYLKTLSPKELQAYHIAKDHLESSFDIIKSNGFLDWLKKKS